MLIKRVEELSVNGDRIKGIGELGRLGAKTGKIQGDNVANAIRFPLRYLAKNGRLSQLQAIEKTSDVSVAGKPLRGRKYDASEGATEYEFKNFTSGNIKWSKIPDRLANLNLEEYLVNGGRLTGEEIEFVSDLIIKGPNLDGVKWVINSKAAGNVETLKKNMLAAFDNEIIVKSFMEKGFIQDLSDLDDIKLNFDTKIFDSLVEFFDDNVVTEIL